MKTYYYFLVLMVWLQYSNNCKSQTPDSIKFLYQLEYKNELHKDIRKFEQKCVKYNDSIYWIDCLASYFSPDSCYHHEPFKITKEEDGIYMSYGESDSIISLLRFPLNTYDTIAVTFNERDVVIFDGAKYITFLGIEELNILGQKRRCFLFKLSYKNNFATGIIKILYLDTELLVPMMITSEKINDKNEVDNRFYYNLMIIGITKLGG